MTIHVAIVDDHQSIIDGYRYRLSKTSGIEVVAEGTAGADLERLLEDWPVDVLLLDLELPTTAEDATPFPVLDIIPDLLQHYPALCILVISMHVKEHVARSVMEAGANGFIVKDDRETIRKLAEVVRQVTEGDIYVSSAVAGFLEGTSETPVLTPRQKEVLALCATHPGETTAAIARRLSVANSTVRNLLSETYFRLGVRNRSAAILEAQRLGLIPRSGPLGAVSG